MAYKITEDCVSCGSCASECPADAISQGDSQFVIDPEKCIECGNCANVCPVGAPVEES
ncbi:MULTISPECIES: DUF362 domain-containing protein [Clostridium]|uniref:Ferredoxin n=4 Tax=Clostridium TaxID=1485 RepID=D8GKQ1_CLOLD|nr:MULTISPECIES: 4Fe-4S binding protein [Clostridium]ADK13234.1 ferredoxin [Clostridium ljungdahlii DSM 13528]AGY76461.1 4Fe-4S binding protein [Clostridium autoethanogenum DSM 10061]ALU36623.1 4Fe-4S ferredoxin iron-sulpur binding domain-containing protein [Clostridium autoethanogenum DSM 10061]OAA83707.1 Ferredoxin [Clostridium ljungdahlii DSM 13528]OAA85744.1 Ferredoxin [Clostridium coskatii]